MHDNNKIPPAALWLGAAGVIPFVACATQIALAWPLEPRFAGPAIYALQLYGAVILSFMGGVQWGLAVRDQPYGAEWRRYGVSVLPAFVAWAGLWFGGRNGLLAVAGGLLGLLAYDLWTVTRGEAPAWYGRLRLGLTAVAVAALALVAVLVPY
jgi:Protein of unknown function (DUF3429)